MLLIRYFADIRPLAGCNEESWGTEAATLRELLFGLAERHGEPFRKRVLAGDAPSPTIILFVNGRNIEHLSGMDTPLRDGDCVAVFPMVAGG